MLKQFKYVTTPKKWKAKDHTLTSIKGHAYAYCPLDSDIQFIVIAPSLVKLRKAWRQMQVPRKLVMWRIQKVIVVGVK